MKLNVSRIALTSLLLVLSAVGAVAQNYPARPIKLVMPYAPGGIVDFVGRKVAQYLADAIGQPVVPENHPGAGGMVGTGVVAHAAADGYTLVIMDPAIVINPTLQPNVPYDLFKQLVTVSLVTSSPEVLVVAPELPVKSLADLIAYGRANPGKLNFASAGTGTTPHLAAELFKQRAGVEAIHVAYRGIGQAFPDGRGTRWQLALYHLARGLAFAP